MNSSSWGRQKSDTSCSILTGCTRTKTCLLLQARRAEKQFLTAKCCRMKGEKYGPFNVESTSRGQCCLSWGAALSRKSPPARGFSVARRFGPSEAKGEEGSWPGRVRRGSPQLHRGVHGHPEKMEVTHGNESTRAEDVAGEVGRVRHGALHERAALHGVALSF